jgi:hypothetical protein
MAIKYINIFQYKAYTIYPNWDFWFENKPSGKPVPHSQMILRRRNDTNKVDDGQLRGQCKFRHTFGDSEIYSCCFLMNQM